MKESSMAESILSESELHADFDPESLDGTFFLLLIWMEHYMPYIYWIIDFYTWKTPLIGIWFLIGYLNYMLWIDGSVVYFVPWVIELEILIDMQSRQSIWNSRIHYYRKVRHNLVQLVKSGKSSFYWVLLRLLLPGYESLVKEDGPIMDANGNFGDFLTSHRSALSQIFRKYPMQVDLKKIRSIYSSVAAGIWWLIALIFYLYVPPRYILGVICNIPFILNAPWVVYAKTLIQSKLYMGIGLHRCNIFESKLKSGTSKSFFSISAMSPEKFICIPSDLCSSCFYDCYDLHNHIYRRVYFVYENQRYWPGLGWLSEFFTTEREKFSNMDGSISFSSLEKASLYLKIGSQRESIPQKWKCVSSSFALNICKEKSSDNSSEVQDPLITLFNWSERYLDIGSNDIWEYGDTYWKKFAFDPAPSLVTRRRLYIHPTILSFINDYQEIEKAINVNL